MTKYLSAITCLALLNLANIICCAQSIRKDKLYTVSGIGTAIPLGQSSDFLAPKISTTLGANLGIGKGGLFLYPKFNLHAFSYSAIFPDDAGNYAVQTGRASTYLLNMALGYRKFTGKFAYYAYAGAGGGFILTPMARINNANQQVNLKNKTHGMPMAELGAGIELNLGGLAVFTEMSYINGFKNIQDRSFTTLPLTFGIKPNLSKLFH